MGSDPRLMKMSIRHNLMSEYKPDAPARVTLRPLAYAAGLYLRQQRNPNEIELSPKGETLSLQGVHNCIGLLRQ